MVIDNDTFFADVLDVLREGRQATIPVKGYSMLPFIRGGKDLVVLEKADGPVKRDDIVLFHVVNQIFAKAVTILRGGKRPVDPYAPGQIRLVRFWQWLLPLRRYLLFVYRHLPWNRSWIKENRNI